jgi:hypothetical protein
MFRCSPWFAAVALLSTGAARADVWDVQTSSDNSHTTTRNELVHGSDQQHDLGALPGPAADQDFYRISQRPYSSYEVVVEATSGDIGGRTLDVVRLAADGTTVVQSSVGAGLGLNRSLRWVNGAGAANNKQFVRVQSGGCSSDCGPEDVYRLRAYETTYSIPRFNNSGSQVTVLLLQNPTDYTISGTVYFWSPAGALVATSPFSLPAKGLQVLATQTVAPGTSGSITVANDGRYGDLTGKTVALEPATGFSFDTAMVPRPH